VRLDDRLLRFRDPDELASYTAARLVDRILALQATQPAVHVLLATGVIALLVDHLSRHPNINEIDAARFHIWWGNENFVDATDPHRASTQALSLLHNALPLLAAHAHTMPQRSGYADAGEAALAYAEEIDGTVFDLCLMAMAADGHILSLYPDHPSLQAALEAEARVIGVLDAPGPVPEQMSVTVPLLGTARRIWILASGPTVADPLSRALADDPTLPTTHLEPQCGLLWLADEAAAARVPTFHCSL